MGERAFTKRDVDDAIAAAIKNGLVVRKYRITRNGDIEVDCHQPQEAADLDMVNWAK